MHAYITIGLIMHCVVIKLYSQILLLNPVKFQIPLINVITYYLDIYNTIGLRCG